MSQILFGDDVRFKNGIVFPIQCITITDYYITNTSGPNGGHDYAIVCTHTDTVTVNLPITEVNGLENGRTYKIIDGSGAITPNIIINAVNQNINGSTTAIINTGRNSLTIMFTNVTSEWRII